MDNQRVELSQILGFKNDVEQLKKYQELFSKSYNNSMLMNKYFSFGTGKTQLNVKFVWVDSFTKQKVESTSPVLDALSCKYNVGVCLARIAIHSPLEGDGIKYACKYM